MTSRLDRLFILLESGSSAVTRRIAAKQIGEVQRLYPHELHNLLNRLIGYLHSNQWDTRIAAAQAIEAVLSNVPQWSPSPTLIKTENSEKEFKDDLLLSFENFNLTQVLQKGARLMGSEGTEFDDKQDDSSDSNSSNVERLQKQRTLLHEKLGIEQANKLGISLNEMITDEDMKIQTQYNNINDQKVPVQEILNLKVSSGENKCQSMSCREMNRAKRKARQQQLNNSSGSLSNRANNLNGSTSTSTSTSTSSSTLEEPEKKKSKIELVENKFEIFYSLQEPVPDATNCWGTDAQNWPLEKCCSRLYLDLFNPKWEIRHGAATALRELINSNSFGAGKNVFMTLDEMDYHHDLWLEDAALKFLCVMSLDRFGDFISDQVVAPVRETCAQVLGTLVKEMKVEKIEKILFVLINLMKQNEWEVRHGGLLGLKYLMVVREDLLSHFLPKIINDVLAALLDQVDDVGAVAASTLIPVSNWLPKLLNTTQVSGIIQMLWDLLLNQDELTSACNSFMGLLASILSLPNGTEWIQKDSMSTLIPRLWPFLSHSSSSVRKSTLKTLQTLTDTQNEKNTNFAVKDWQAPLLQEALRHIYQRILIEPNKEIQMLSMQVWQNLIHNAELSALLHAACPYVSSWICLAMQPVRLAFDINLLLFPKTMFSYSSKRNELGGNSSIQTKLYIGGTEATPQDIREKNHIRSRIFATNVLGLLSQYLVKPAPGVTYTLGIESPIDCYTKVLLGHLQSKSAMQRIVCSLIISFWARAEPKICPGPVQLQEILKNCVLECTYYDEVGILFTRLLQEAQDFISTLKQYKISITEFENIKILTLDQIQLLCTTMTEQLKNKHQLKPKISDMLEERKKSLQNSLKNTCSEQNAYNISTQAAIAGAIVCMRCLPDKLNPIIKPLMESIKREECELLQQLSAEFLVELLDQVADRIPTPNSKIVTNLCALLKSDLDFTPKIIFPDKNIDLYQVGDGKNPYFGILSLNQQCRLNGIEHFNSNVQPSTSAVSTRGPGRPPVNLDISMDDVLNVEDPLKKQNRIQRLGAASAIIEICKYFGENLIKRIPAIWQIMFETIDRILIKLPKFETFKLNYKEIIEDDINDLITALQLCEIAVPHMNNKLHVEIFKLLPKYESLLTHPLKGVRNMVTRCIATLATIDDCKILNFVVERIIPMLETIDNIIYRQGAAEAIYRIVDKLQLKMVPYVVLLVVPLLGRMSDPEDSIRLISTQCFATLIQLMPLDIHNSKSSIIPEIKSKELRERKIRDREFLEYLFLPKTIPDFKVPIPIAAELRGYQQAGLNWLWFLNKYNLHGILCDDMGLGKTLQTICILAGDHHNISLNKKLNELPSIVICPPTLTGHWVYEVQKFLPNKFLRALHYAGLPHEREKLRNQVGKYNLVVASYDTVRKDIEFFTSIQWNYCVLDEGHIIKNGKTKSSKAIKLLKALHRLILSGTPIQNNVLELWSLFDFLMPGFLGTEKQFILRYSKPILSSRDAKSSAKEQEAGVLAMEALHRQVLPFLLRRVKEDVLTDLPPKITQDLLCELSPLQERLYEDFSKTHLNSEIKDCIEQFSGNNGENLNKKTHIFQALRYLQNVCNHPKLVLNSNHPEYEKIMNELSSNHQSLDEIDHSAKLPALKQLLLDCGIGIDENNDIVNQHRALIFCQLKTMLDIVEKDLLRKHLPSVSYLRLDGSVPAYSRHEIVTKFNADPSIDVLLLTTQVGGLGLNLTGADTVIFVEHDWNPMKDLQAMDRAHRIGQKKVVNVYRLITRKSLEEKIMGLQKFKILTANTVVNTENANMETMGTDKLLDLFNLSEEDRNKQTKSSSATSSISMKQVIDNLPEIWDENQYEEEYDLSQFVKSLKKSNSVIKN